MVIVVAIIATWLNQTNQSLVILSHFFVLFTAYNRLYLSYYYVLSYYSLLCKFCGGNGLFCLRSCDSIIRLSVFSC